MTKLKFKDMLFGKIDAYNEFVEYGEEKIKNLLIDYPSVNIETIKNGIRYYILGDKGTGKTMLLKYIQSSLNPSIEFYGFIRFKKDVDEDQRRMIKRSTCGETVAPESSTYEETVAPELPQDINCILAWQVYLVKFIISRLIKTECGIFKRNEIWRELSTALEAVYDQSLKNTAIFDSIIPTVKQGKIEINIGKYGKLNLDLEWGNSKIISVPFISLAKYIIDLYTRLEIDDTDEHKLYILIDELELSLKKSKKYERDTMLIRDLVFAIQYTNEIHKIHGYKIYIIAAIRNEIYKHISSKGMEINKPITDYGIHISWKPRADGDLNEHPLLKIIEKRIKYSESISGITNDNIWDTYFIPAINFVNNKENLKIYLLNQTWYKPRDIIRFFNIIQSNHGEKDFATQTVFESIRQEYAEKSWEEFEEELIASYSDKEIEGIRQMLIGLSLPFGISDLLGQIDSKANTYHEIKLLENKIHQLVRDLYDIGVIGNLKDHKFRFTFKGDKNIDPSQPFTLHKPLIKFFKASIRAYK